MLNLLQFSSENLVLENVNDVGNTRHAACISRAIDEEHFELVKEKKNACPNARNDFPYMVKRFLSDL